MPPKIQNNGFYMYMQDQRKIIQAQTKRMPPMREMPALCRDTWQHLSAAERAKYDNLAKQEKERLRNTPNNYKMDNQRQIIAHRVDEKLEDKKRREGETRDMVKSWAGKDILNIEFSVIHFQVMYIMESEEDYLPMEIGMVCFTLKDGIKKFLHHFIDPGDPPQGNRHQAQTHSDSTHQIPLNFEQADSNYLGLWMRMERFLAEDPARDDILPIFCLSSDRKIVESCLEFIHYRSNSGTPNRLHKVYCLEDLLTSLLMQSGKMERNPAENQISDTLRQNRWDYTGSIRCPYHEEVDSSHCSLSVAKRTSFAMFDLLSNIYEFPLTANHMPDETAQRFTVVHPSSFGHRMGRNRDGSRSDISGSRGDMSSASSVRSASPPSFAFPHQPSPAPVGAVGGAVEKRVVIKLSDEEDSEEEADRDEIPSTADRYQLKELRKPKTPSLMQGVGAQGPLSSLGRGVAALAVRDPQGAPPRPRAWGQPTTVAPPPGMGPPAGMAPLAATDQWPALSGSSAMAGAAGVASKPAHPGRTAGGRGRGMPRQVPQ